MPDDDATEVWRDKLESHRLAPDCTPHLLADQYGAPAPHVLDEVCNEAIQHVVADGRTEFEYDDFVRAFDTIDTDSEAPTAAGESIPSSVTASADRADLERRVAELEHETERLRRVANRDVPLLKGTVKRLVGADPDAAIEDLPGLAAERGDDA